LFDEEASFLECGWAGQLIGLVVNWARIRLRRPLVTVVGIELETSMEAATDEDVGK
jgi:hypothetical protein